MANPRENFGPAYSSRAGRGQETYKEIRISLCRAGTTRESARFPAMDVMPLHPTYPDIALRLALTLLAGGLIGFNREVRGEKAGLRTTMLVALAAAVAMIQA